MYFFHYPRIMAGYSGGTGCTILIWVDNDTWRLEGLEGSARFNQAKELLEDAGVLLSARWNLELSYVESGNVLYGFLSCPRFTIGSATIIRALGTLAGAIQFHRGAASDTAEGLIRYVQCKQKYEVPDQVSGDTSGETETGPTSTGSWGTKRQRR